LAKVGCVDAKYGTIEPVAAKAADVARKSRRLEVERCITMNLS
jgi:hypothetical protein